MRSPEANSPTEGLTDKQVITSESACPVQHLQQTAQMLQRQKERCATVISMPVLCAARLICRPCLDKEFCLVSLALARRFAGSRLPLSPLVPFLPLFLSLHLLTFFPRSRDDMMFTSARVSSVDMSEPRGTNCW